jgi:DNA-binding response OmpR family regulator
MKAYDFVFMDMFMPLKNGLEASMEIRRDNIWDKCPFIIGMITFDSISTRQQCLDSGMGDVLCKPLSRQAFLQAIAATDVCKMSATPGISADLNERGSFCICQDRETLGATNSKQSSSCQAHPRSLASARCQSAASAASPPQLSQYKGDVARLRHHGANAKRNEGI